AADLNTRCESWTSHLGHFAGMVSTPQNILAEEEVLWVGHPVAMVVARTRAEAEDACEFIMLELDDLPPVCGVEAALDPDMPAAVSSLSSNLCFRNELKTDGVEDAFAGAALVVEGEYTFGRHTAVTLEPRAV